MNGFTVERAMQIKMIRRGLIETLKRCYPASLDCESLLHVFAEVELHHLRADLSYLADKGYVKCVNEQPNLAWPKRRFILTAAGVEIADRVVIDPALIP